MFYQAISNTGDEFVESIESPAVPLSSAPHAPAPAFPMMPYGGVRGSGMADYRILESQVIAPLRRRQIHDIYVKYLETGPELPLLPTGTTAPGNGVTPEGLLVKFSSDFAKWERVLLAKDASNPPKQLQVEDLGRESPFRAALQSNKLFLVITDPQELAAHFPHNEVEIAGWKFRLDPALWEAHNTILIFKYQDRPLRDLVEQTTQWALAEQFNQDIDATRRRLSQLVRDALATTSADATPLEKDKWQELTRAALNPQWSGILALNVPVGLPAELSGLAAGIRGDGLTARYFGVDSTPVKPRNGVLEAGRSSLFGLIDYLDKEPPDPNDSGFNFQVTSIVGVFRNSALTRFSAELEVSLDKLFEEGTELEGGAGGRNIIVLKGTSENHDGQTTYSFSFTGDNEFALPASTTIQEVEILKASFSSDPLVPEPTGWKVDQADHAVGATTVRLKSGSTNPKSGDLFDLPVIKDAAGHTVKTDAQTYAVTSFANNLLTYTPAAATAFANDTALTFGVPQTARFSFWGNLVFRSWTAQPHNAIPRFAGRTRETRNHSGGRRRSNPPGAQRCGRNWRQCAGVQRHEFSKRRAALHTRGEFPIERRGPQARLPVQPHHACYADRPPCRRDYGYGQCGYGGIARRRRPLDRRPGPGVQGCGGHRRRTDIHPGSRNRVRPKCGDSQARFRRIARELPREPRRTKPAPRQSRSTSAFRSPRRETLS